MCVQIFLSYNILREQFVFPLLARPIFLYVARLNVDLYMHLNLDFVEMCLVSIVLNNI